MELVRLLSARETPETSRSLRLLLSGRAPQCGGQCGLRRWWQDTLRRSRPTRPRAKVLLLLLGLREVSEKLCFRWRFLGWFSLRQWTCYSLLPFQVGWSWTSQQFRRLTSSLRNSLGVLQIRCTMTTTLQHKPRNLSFSVVKRCVCELYLCPGNPLISCTPHPKWHHRSPVWNMHGCRPSSCAVFPSGCACLPSVSVSSQVYSGYHLPFPH